MKRELLCKKCGAESRQMFGSNEPYSGEFVKFIRGSIIVPYICDHCGMRVNEGLGIALSIFTTTRPYFEWEHEYLGPVLIEYTKEQLLNERKL